MDTYMLDGWAREDWEKLATFVQKLLELFERFPDVVSWAPSGESFYIAEEPVLVRVLPLVFKHNKFSSLIRQLNMYGFHKVKNDSRLEFQNTNFKRGHPERLFLIVRRAPKRRPRSSTAPATPVSRQSSVCSDDNDSQASMEISASTASKFDDSCSMMNSSASSFEEVAPEEARGVKRKFEEPTDAFSARSPFLWVPEEAEPMHVSQEVFSKRPKFNSGPLNATAESAPHTPPVLYSPAQVAMLLAQANRQWVQSLVRNKHLVVADPWSMNTQAQWYQPVSFVSAAAMEPTVNDDACVPEPVLGDDKWIASLFD